MAGEPRTVDACASLREACRSAIFEKLGENHSETLAQLSGIKVALAILSTEGEARAKAANAAVGAAEAAVKLASVFNGGKSSILYNPIVIAVASAILTSALMGGLAFFFLRGGN